MSPSANTLGRHTTICLRQILALARPPPVEIRTREPRRTNKSGV